MSYQTSPLSPNNEKATGLLDPENPSAFFRMSVTDPGTYHIWTSFVKGLVSVVGHPVTGIQQLMVDLAPGDYTVVVSSPTPDVPTSFKIYARKYS